MPKIVDPQQRREHIAAALMRVAADQGLEAVSLRHVAAEAGVTSGMVQHYFPTKEAMMVFAMRSATARYEARMTAALMRLGDGATPRDTVGVVLRTLLPLDDSQRADARVALAFQSYTATRRTAGAELTPDDADLRDFVAEQVRLARPPGHGSPADDPVPVATALLALAEGLAVLLLSTTLSTGDALAALYAQLDLVLGTDGT